MIKDNGGPAFPVAYWDKDKMRYIDNGMSLRDYFSAAALQGMLAAADLDTKAINAKGNGDFFKGMAAISYQYSDAMIAERNK